MYAAEYGYPEIVAILVQQGADVNMKNNVSYIISIICYNDYNYVILVWIQSSYVCCYRRLYRHGNYPTTTRS